VKFVRVAHLLFASAVVLIAGCGGTANSGGSGGTTPPSSPPVPQSLQITTTSIPPALVGTPYSTQLTAINGSGTLKWSVTGLIPAGLNLSSGGLLSGTPSNVGCNTNITVSVTDSSTPPQTAAAPLAYSAAEFVVDLKGGQVGTFYDDVIQFSCGTDPVSWSLVSGSLPPGLQMQPFPGTSSQLNFEGTPTKVGIFPLTVQAKDGSNRTGQQSASITILPSALVITDGLMQLGAVNQPFDHIVPTSGGTPPYSFNVSVGALAQGLQLNASTGEISGKPTTAGLYQFNIKATDTTGPTPFTFEKPYTLLVTPAAVSARNDTLANATPIFPGTYLASLSPYTDSAGNPAPDQDYYSLTANGGDVYSIGAVASQTPFTSATNPGLVISAADPAIEVLDSTGARMITCNDPVADSPPAGAPIAKGTGQFTDACVGHGGPAIGNGLSTLTLQLPQGSNQKFYIHVFDFNGRARPDFLYTLTVTKK
jgi:hypothetical protein